MTDLELVDCFQSEPAKLERVNYFPRQLLTADDMVADQDYFRQKMRRHNRFLHGWGVVCGLEVTPAPLDQSPLRVQIGSGYALGPYGDEISVAEPIHFDLARCMPGATTDPCEPDLVHPSPGMVSIFYVAIKYAECEACPVRVLPTGCGCDEEACEYSRIRDSFQIGCLDKLPPSPPAPSLCVLLSNKDLPECLTCPSDPWVVLAEVRLPIPSATIAELPTINNGIRRQVYSTTILQKQLIDCCCKDMAPQPGPAANLEIITTGILVESTVPGITFQYALMVTNHGPSAAQNVVVTDFPPVRDGATIALTSAHWTQSGPGGPLVAHLETLGARDQTTLGFRITFPLSTAPSETPVPVLPPAAGATFVNRAWVISDTYDPDLNNNLSILVTTLSTVVPPN